VKQEKKPKTLTNQQNLIANLQVNLFRNKPKFALLDHTKDTKFKCNLQYLLVLLSVNVFVISKKKLNQIRLSFLFLIS
jgi:hypothetical protein